MNLKPTYCDYGFCSKPGIRNYNQKFYEKYGIRPNLEKAQDSIAQHVRKLLREGKSIATIGNLLKEQQDRFLHQANTYSDGMLLMKKSSESYHVWSKNLAKAVANLQACYLLYHRLVREIQKDREKHGTHTSPYHGRGSPQRKGSY